MGTNYYWHPNKTDSIHIGKSSGGWCFSLHVIPDAGIKDLPDWEKKFEEPGSQIFDEYDRPVTVGEMMKVITERQWRDGKFPEEPGTGESWGKFHDQNFSQFGPNGLLRKRISEKGCCVGHGEGTWDLVTGEFS